MKIIAALKHANARLAQSVKARPVLVAAVLTGSIAFGLSTLLLADVFYAALGEPLDGLLIAYHYIVLLCIPLFWWGAARWRKPMCLLLALALLGTPAARAEEPPPEPLVWFIAGAVVVIVGGGLIIGCRAYKCANRIARQRTNVVEEINFVMPGAGGTGYGAAFSKGAVGYCVQHRELPKSPVAFTMSIQVASATNAITTLRADAGQRYVQDLSQFRDELAGAGLELATGPGRTESYAWNQEPAPAGLVPITFDWDSQTVSVNAGTVLVTVDASEDLIAWAPLLRIKVLPGAIVELADATEDGKQFYRVAVAADQ